MMPSVNLTDSHTLDDHSGSVIVSGFSFENGIFLTLGTVRADYLVMPIVAF